MKINRINSKRKLKNTTAPEKTALQALHLGMANGLSDKESKALYLLSEWEGLTPIEYCKLGIQAYLQSSFIDIQYLAKAENRPEEKVWAQKYLSLIEPLVPSIPNSEILADAIPRMTGQRADITLKTL
jgi:hypothetical protein